MPGGAVAGGVEVVAFQPQPPPQLQPHQQQQQPPPHQPQQSQNGSSQQRDNGKLTLPELNRLPSEGLLYPGTERRNQRAAR